MNKIIQEIARLEFNEEIQSIKEIVGLGSVNQIFDIQGKDGSYIVRLNEDLGKEIEYRKEKWCIETVSNLGIPSPKILGTGLTDKVVYMVQEKIRGKNGKQCTSIEKENIWRALGRYAKTFNQVKKIEDQQVEEAEFHASWKARLEYNLIELNSEDSLLQKKVFTPREHQISKSILTQLVSKKFQVGLVHGDLCPRNVIQHQEKIYLLDWGTAEINVIPHTELGIMLMSKEASENEFQAFKQGYGISNSAYLEMENEIESLNFLHTLDKYRWAESYDVENIKTYEDNIRDTFSKINITNN